MEKIKSAGWLLICLLALGAACNSNNSKENTKSAKDSSTVKDTTGNAGYNPNQPGAQNGQ